MFDLKKRPAYLLSGETQMIFGKWQEKREICLTGI